MIARLMLILSLFAPVLFAPAMASAQDRDVAGLTRLDTDSPEAFAFFDALGIYDFLVIITDETRMGAEEIQAQFFPGVALEIWQSDLDRLLTPEAVIGRFEQAWDDDAVDAAARQELMEFFTSEFGQTVVEAEIAARAAISDPAIREAGREALLLALSEDDPRLETYAEHIDAHDLIGTNVAGALNGQFRFLSGLQDGGGMPNAMSERDMLGFIAGQEALIRSETQEWMMIYHFMAYGALSETEFARYSAVTLSPEGRMMMAGMMAAFDDMFDGLQYELGRAAARYAAGDDI